MAWFKNTRNERHEYDETEEASVGLIQSEKAALGAKDHDMLGRRLSHFNIALIGLLAISNLFWIVVNFRLWSHTTSLQDDYNTDFVSARILPTRSVAVNFDDLLMWNSSSREVYRAMDPSLPLYFGKPSPAIDAAWKDLMRFEYPAVSEDEISRNPHLSFGPGDRHPVTGKHHIALDVFHNLHCLNAVRKELDKDYYGTHNHGHVGRSDHNAHESSSAVEAAQRDHIDHCLNHIRQALQCRPDFSPAAMSVFTDTDGSKFFLGNAKQHSCYDWKSVMAWAEAREADPGFASTMQ